MATLHACLDEAADGMAVTRAIKAELKSRFSIGHATVEIERGLCADKDVAGHHGHGLGHGGGGQSHEEHFHEGHRHAAAPTSAPACASTELKERPA